MNTYCYLCNNQTLGKFSFTWNNDPKLRYVCKKHLDWTLKRTSVKNLQPLAGKEVRRYNLPLDHKYTLLGTEYLGSLLDGGGSSCENCGKLIVNVATVKTEQGKVYGIGLDCAETLSFVDRSDFWKLKEAEALHSKMMGWVRKVKLAQKEGKVVTAGYDNTYKCWIVYYNGVWQFRLTEKTYQVYFKKII